VYDGVFYMLYTDNVKDYKLVPSKVPTTRLPRSNLPTKCKPVAAGLLARSSAGFPLQSAVTQVKIIACD